MIHLLSVRLYHNNYGNPCPKADNNSDEQVKVLFEETASKSPGEIIEHLKKAGEAWANGRDQEDDVTFVVIKIK